MLQLNNHISILGLKETSWDTTEGFFSRWVVVPFSAFFPAGRADPTLIDRLTSQSELQGLLRAAVGGLGSVMRRGAFAIPPSVANATARFKREADPMRGFIEERVQGVNSSMTHVGRAEVYNAYTTWATINGYHQMSAQLFYEKFMAACVDALQYPVIQTKRRGDRGYTGIRLK